MRNSLRMAGDGRRRLLAMCLLLLCGAASAIAQPAPKQQTSSSPSASAPARVTQTQVDASIADDKAVNQMLTAYAPKVRALDTVIGKLTGELRKGGTGAGSLGNFVTDGMRWQAAIKAGKPITLAVMNSGGMRRNTIGEGELRARDIFELLPFENALITIELTGEQLRKLLEMVVTSNEAQSGAHIVYRAVAERRNELQSVKLRGPAGEQDIDPARTYTVVTIDYLYNVGGRYSILREGKNMHPLGITLRDAMMAYVKSETAAGRHIQPNLDGRFSLDVASPPPARP